MKEFKFKKEDAARVSLGEFVEIGIFDKDTLDQLNLKDLVDLDELTAQLKKVDIPKGKWLQVKVNILPTLTIEKEPSFKRE